MSEVFGRLKIKNFKKENANLCYRLKNNFLHFLLFINDNGN